MPSGRSSTSINNENEPLLNNNNNNDNSRRSICNQLNFVANAIVHLLLFTFTGFVTYISFAKGVVLFSWHPPLMLFGFFILMTEAILCFCDANIFTYHLRHKLKKRIQLHWILQAVAGCSITASFVIIIMNKIRLDKDHFTSDHGKVGLTAIVCAAVSIVGGIPTLYSFQLRHWAPPMNLKIGHASLAMCTYVLGLAAIILGLYSPWFLENATYETIAGCIVVIVVAAALAIAMPLIKTVRRVRRLAA